MNCTLDYVQDHGLSILKVVEPLSCSIDLSYTTIVDVALEPSTDSNIYTNIHYYINQVSGSFFLIVGIVQVVMEALLNVISAKMLYTTVKGLVNNTSRSIFLLLDKLIFGPCILAELAAD